MRLVAAIVLTLGLSLFSLTQSHSQWNGCQAGFCNQSTGVAAYQGPGDVVSGALAWWGLRCYNAAYTGSIADVWDSATGSTTETLLTCSSGGVINETINSLATTCATACSIKTLFDQSGNTNCSSAACNLSQATNADRPTFTRNCITTKPCLTFNGTTTFLSNGGNLVQAQPFSINAVAQRTGNFTSNGRVFTFVASVILNFTTSANTFGIFAGSNLTGAATDNTMFGFMTLFNNTTSKVFKNGASLASGTAGTNAPSTSIVMGAASIVGGGNFLTGNVTEGGIWAGDKTGSAASLNTNQQSYYGY